MLSLFLLIVAFLIPLAPTAWVIREVLREAIRNPQFGELRSLEWLFPLRGKWLYYGYLGVLLTFMFPFIYVGFAIVLWGAFYLVIGIYTSFGGRF